MESSPRRDERLGVILVVSGVLFIAFAFTRSAQAGLPLWFLRIAILSAYFSTMPALILRTPGVHAARATVLSVVAVVTSLGTILSAAVIGTLGAGVSLHWVTGAGGVLTMLAGGLMWWGAIGRRASSG